MLKSKVYRISTNHPSPITRNSFGVGGDRSVFCHWTAVNVLNDRLVSIIHYDHYLHTYSVF